jgi:hypothetical protein
MDVKVNIFDTKQMDPHLIQNKYKQMDPHTKQMDPHTKQLQNKWIFNTTQMDPHALLADICIMICKSIMRIMM